MVNVQRIGGGISVNPAEVIAQDMARLPEASRGPLRSKLREAAGDMADDARTRAAWSSRIPPTVKVRTSFRSDREGVDLVAGGPSAPHARPYEGFTGKAVFRHPVYADATKNRATWTWVPQATRPFLVPAVEAGAEAATQKLRTALDEAAASLGFGG